MGKKVCNNCASVLELGEKYCSECGTKIEGNEVEEPSLEKARQIKREAEKVLEGMSMEGREKRYICTRCLHILKGMPKKDKESKPTGVATTIKIGRVYSTYSHTSSHWTGEYWCGECRALGGLEIFLQVLLPIGQRKRINKLIKRSRLDKALKIQMLFDNGVVFGTRWG